MIDPEVLAVLVCPITRTPLVYDEAAGELRSEAAGLAYPVRQGTPVLLVEEARVLSSESDAVSHAGSGAIPTG